MEWMIDASKFDTPVIKISYKEDIKPKDRLIHSGVILNVIKDALVLKME
jgi:hypothetical protein